MKKLILLLVLAFTVNAFTETRKVGAENCFPSQKALFNPMNYFDCVVTTNTCETFEATLKGYYLESATGKCPVQKEYPMYCGHSEEIMRHPTYKYVVEFTNNACETNVLLEMGWEVLK